MKVVLDRWLDQVWYLTMWYLTSDQVPHGRVRSMRVPAGAVGDAAAVRWRWLSRGPEAGLEMHWILLIGVALLLLLLSGVVHSSLPNPLQDTYLR